MEKVLVVITEELSNRILAVYPENQRTEAEACARAWMNGCAGKNIWSGLSIGTRREFGKRARVEVWEVRNPLP